MIVSLEPELLARLTRLDDPSSAAATEELDEDLATAFRRTERMRKLFYAAVLAVALYGSATGAAAAFGLPWWIAIGGVFALELGGVTFLSNADVRRRLGEPATTSRLFGASITGAAATFNVITHHDRLLGGFFALMSILGFISWWLDAENKRRDRLRARGMLPPTTPKYELWSHWSRHPIITARARSVARAYPQLDLYGSLQAALIIQRRQQRNTALARALNARIRRTVGNQMAHIAVLTYDLDEIAQRLRATADYDGLTSLVAGDLTAERLLNGRDDESAASVRAWQLNHIQDRRPDLHDTAANIADNLKARPRTRPPESAARLTRHGPTEGCAAAHAGGQSLSATSESAQPTVDVSIEARRPEAAFVVDSRPRPLHGAVPSRVLSAAQRPGGAVTATVQEPHEPDHADRPDSPAPPGTPTERIAPAVKHPATPSPPRVRIVIVGEPAILDADGQPVHGLRAKSLELLVFLAVHRAGAGTADIIAALWPDVPTPRAIQRLSTCLSNLRSNIRGILHGLEQPNQRTSEGPADPIVNTGGHYHLDSAIVDVDWWQLLDGQHSGLTRSGAEAINATKDRIADHCHYQWLHIADDR